MSGEGRRRVLEREGYQCSFACTYGDQAPDDLTYPKSATGWDMRRALKAWCVKHGITDYRIFVATDYVRDLRGPRVYELWIPTKAQP